MASKTVKTIKVPGAKAPKLASSIPAKLPSTPKMPQLASNLNPFAQKPFLPKTAK